jgi:hypothetical protein
MMHMRPPAFFAYAHHASLFDNLTHRLGRGVMYAVSFKLWRTSSLRRRNGL